MEIIKNVAAVIINWNSSERTINCLQRLSEARISLSDIFVVDNGSTDNSVSVIIKKHPKVQIIINENNLGFGGGCNSAIRKILENKGSCAKNYHCYDYILLLNTDAGLDKQNLEALIKTLDKNPNIGVVGPLIVDKDVPTSVLSAGGLDPSLHVNTYDTTKLREKNNNAEPYEVCYVSGTVALLRKSVVTEIGYFDEDYFFSCEMADLCERIKEKMFACAITPRAIAWHEMESAGEQRNILYLYYIIRNRFLYIRKFKRKRIILLFVYWGLLGVFFILKALISGKYKSARAIFLALRDGLLGRYGGRNDLFT